MATIQIKTDRKQISLILNLIKIDCSDLYGKFHQKKSQLKQAIERYEEFMTNEINDTLFQCNNNFSDVVLNHRTKFSKFIEEFSADILDNASSDQPQQQQPVTNGKSYDNSIYVLFISLQHWLVQGPKGQHFCFMIDIDSFNYTQLSEQQHLTITKKTNDATTVPVNDDITLEKKAKLIAIDFLHETFIAFKGDKLIDCDNSMTKNVKQIQYFLKKNHYDNDWPVKCVYWLLHRLFYSVEIAESIDEDAKSFTSKICVSYNAVAFEHTSKLSKIDAKNHASLKALQQLCDIENKLVREIWSDRFPLDFAQEVQRKVLSIFQQRVNDVDLDNRSNVLAGIIQTNGIDLNTAKVVVVASGTKNIDAESLSPDALNDTHAEIVARRALMFYFYQQLEIFLNSAKSSESIFERSPYGHGIRLKDNIHFHLYISKVPCGDATPLGNSEWPTGLLRAKIEKSMGTSKLIDLKKMQNGYDLQIQAMYTITCSDKIARWNVVGVQGALLSRIVEPIYFRSIILGNKHLRKDHIEHSLYDRIESSLGCLPRFYDHKKPYIAFADSGRRWTHHEAPKISVNWIIDCSVEVIESKTGKSVSNNGRSRISKRSLFHRFIGIKNKLPYMDRENNSTPIIYAIEKEKATEYQDAKNACIEAFDRLKLGNWKFVQKPEGNDEFGLMPTT